MIVKMNRWRCAGLVGGAMTLAMTTYAGPKYEQNIDKTFDVAPGSQLEVSADMGTIHVVTGADNKLVIHVLRRVEGGEKKDADEIFSGHEVTFEQEGNTVSVVAKNKNHTQWSNRQSLEISYEITAPRKFNFELSTAGGDIGLEDVDGKLEARTSSGSIRAGEVTGSVTAKDAGGDIVIKGAGQDARASTSSGTIEIHKAGGKVDASNAGGDIRIGDAAASVTAHTSSGAITIASAQGDVESANAGGDIHVTRAGGKVFAHTSSGSITIGAADGDVATTDAGGDILIDKAGGNVSAETTSGRIEIGVAKGEKVRAENHGGNVEVRDASGEIETKTSSGSIKIGSVTGAVKAWNAGGDITIDNARSGADVRTTSGSINIGASAGNIDARNAGGSIKVADAGHAVNAETSSGTIEVLFLTAPREDCRLTVSGGDINVSLPPGAQLNIDATSLGGSVQSEWPMTIGGKVRDGTLKGQINGGGPNLTMHSTSGDIRLKRSSASQVRADADPKH
jgi:hypothetical protein